MNKFVRQDRIFLNKALRDKAGLHGGNNFMEERFKSVGKDFGKNFVEDVAEANGSKMGDKCGISFFGNENQVGVVKRLEEETQREKLLHCLYNIQLNNIPKRVKKQGSNTIGAGCFCST